MRRLAGSCLPLVLLVALPALACNLAASQHNEVIAVDIMAPSDGMSVPVNQPVTISSLANDPDGPGVSSVELFIDGVAIQTDTTPGSPQVSFVCNQTWVPESEGRASIMVIAYREDGTASTPATITLNVVGLTPATAAPPTASDEEVTEASETPAPTPETVDETEVPAVQGQITLEANIRSEPGSTCPIIGVAGEGVVINLLEYSADDQWFRTDYLEERVGWVWTGTVEVLGDESEIPHGDQAGCAGCGDETCSGGEDCSTCPQDCGACAAVCGDGTCAEMSAGENCMSCPADCGDCCGDGACDAVYGENPCTCPEDCPGICAHLAVCGDDTCNTVVGENCLNCPEDCGVCDAGGDECVGEGCPAYPWPGVISDRAAKENLTPVDEQAVLDALVNVPVTTWNYISDGQSATHMGPMAQDFYRAFGLGDDDSYIHLVDANGVTTASIQALYGLVKDQEAGLAAQQAQIADLEARLVALEESTPRTLIPSTPLELLLAALLAGGSLGCGVALERWLRRNRKA